MITILGIDSGSKTIGYGLVGIDNNKIILIEHGNIKPPKRDNMPLILRLDWVSKEIDLLCKKLNPTYVIIEDIIQFMKNHTTANTIITLATFNRTVALQVYKTLGKVPLFLLPISIRSKIKNYLGRKEKIEKEEMPYILQKQFGKDFFKFIGYKKRGKNKGQPVVEVMDEADAVAAAWAGSIELRLLENK